MSIELYEQEKVIKCLENTAKYYDMPQADEWTKGIHYGLLHGIDNILDNVSTVKAIPIKQLEEMYDKFQKKLWREHEDVRGDDMIEVGYAEQFLQELLVEFGCWDNEEEQ